MRLPSTRRLAEYLNVSRLTVSLAYQELVSQGYLEAAERSGYIIYAAPRSPGCEPDGGDDRAGGGLDWPARFQKRFSIAAPIRKPLDWRRYPYPFLYGQTDMTLFDLAAWRDCTRRALARADFDFMAGDFAAADDMQLVQYICSRSLPRRGITARPEEILVTVGAQNALWIVIQLLLGEGRHAVCEDPGHPDIPRLPGAEWCAGDGGPGRRPTGCRPNACPQASTSSSVTPSHHAPTAVRMPIDRRRRLLEMAERDDFVIVEDDYEFEMSFLEPPAPALRSLDRRGRALMSAACQPALKRDPLSAPKRDPSRWLGERAWRAGACRLRRRVRRVSGVEGRSGAVLEAPALVAGLNDVAVVSEPVEERGGHLGVAEDAWPFPEREVGRDDH